MTTSAVRREIHYRPAGQQCPKLRDLPIRDQWAWIDRFFSRCTDSTPLAQHATLQICDYDSAPHEAWRARSGVLADAIAEAASLLGQPKYKPCSVVDHLTTWEWEISAATGPTAIDIIARGEPWQGNGARPISITFGMMFNLRDPASGKILPHQASPAEQSWHGASHMIGGIGPSPWHKPQFVFPFERVDAPFLKYLASFTKELPYRLGPRHFRSVRPVTDDARIHFGFLSPEDDALIRHAQVRGQRTLTNTGADE